MRGGAVQLPDGPVDSLTARCRVRQYRHITSALILSAALMAACTTTGAPRTVGSSSTEVVVAVPTVGMGRQPTLDWSDIWNDERLRVQIESDVEQACATHGGIPSEMLEVGSEGSWDSITWWFRFACRPRLE